jgi:acylphosphatase
MQTKRLRYKTFDGKVVVMAYFEGRVQRVSFRWTCCTCATKAGLGGYVLNTDDGEVKAVFRGTWRQIVACLLKLRDEFQLTYTRFERLPVTEFIGDTFYVQYEDGRKEEYIEPINHNIGNNNYISKEDRDFIYGGD